MYASLFGICEYEDTDQLLLSHHIDCTINLLSKFKVKPLDIFCATQSGLCWAPLNKSTTEFTIFHLIKVSYRRKIVVYCIDMFTKLCVLRKCWQVTQL